MYLITEFKKFVENGKIDIPELQPIYDALKNDGFLILSSKLVNKRLNIKAKKIRDPDYRFSRIKNLFKRIDLVEYPFDIRFDMNKKTDEYSTLWISFLLTKSIEKSVNNLFTGELTKYIEKYNIKSFDELIIDLTHVVRDLNRYIKIHNRRELYEVKKNFIEFLYNNDYIESIVRHTYGEDSIYLATTKIQKTDKDDTGRDTITFHMINNDLKKMGIDYKNLPDGGYSPKKKYVQKDIANTEKIEEALSFLSNINSKLLNSAKALF